MLHSLTKEYKVHLSPLLQGKWSLERCEPSSLGGLLQKDSNAIAYRQLYNHTFVHKQTHKERHIYKHKCEEHIKITNN